MVSDLSESPGAAVLLAGLYETSPDDPPAVYRTSTDSRNQKWWAILKDKLGAVETPHLVYLPQNYDEDKKKQWPLMLFLHGAGERGEDLEMLKQHGPPQMIARGHHFPFIVISPQCPLGSWWRPADLTILLDKVEAKYRVDAERIYCTGLSMGGFGTWSLAAEQPERFAAIAPICGGGDVRDVARIKDVPIWAFHGAKDDTVPAEMTQKLVDALRDLGASPKFTLYPDAYHNSWGVTYANPKLYDWFLQHKLPEKGERASQREEK